MVSQVDFDAWKLKVDEGEFEKQKNEFEEQKKYFEEQKNEQEKITKQLKHDLDMAQEAAEMAEKREVIEV